MSAKELTRLEVMQRLKAHALTQREAARLLGLSVRHVRRLWCHYQQAGAAGLVSRKRGRPSNHRLDPAVREAALSLLHSRYHDFGPTFAHEKLVEVHQLQVSRESVRQLMIAVGLWRPKHARKPVRHWLRPRRACFGELVQIDGSPYAWFEDRGPACTLLVYIDDATGRLLELFFTPAESTFSYFAATRAYLLRYGKPVALYSDKHGIFRVNLPGALEGTGLTQFGRAMTELGIEIICANTPQAKGRVERAHETLQDRLVKELRLRGISDLEGANAYAPAFLDDFNRRFAVPPASPHDAHRPLLPSEDLARIFTLQNLRTVSQSLTFQYDHVLYQIEAPGATYAFRHARVLVREDAAGRITVEYKGRVLPCMPVRQQERQAEIVSSKEVASAVETAKAKRQPYIPESNHPWRSPAVLSRGAR